MNIFARCAVLMFGTVWRQPVLWLGIFWIQLSFVNILTFVAILLIEWASGAIVTYVKGYSNFYFLGLYLKDFSHCCFSEVTTNDFIQANGDENPQYLFTLEKPCRPRLFCVSNPSKTQPGPSQHVAFVDPHGNSFLFIRDSPLTANVVAKFWVRHEVGHCRLAAVMASFSSLYQTVRLGMLLIVTLIFTPWIAFPSQPFFEPLILLLAVIGIQRLAWPSWKQILNEEISADEFAMANTPTDELRLIAQLYGRNSLPRIPNLSNPQNQMRGRSFLLFAKELLDDSTRSSDGNYVGAERYPPFHLILAFFFLFLFFSTTITSPTWGRFVFLLAVAILMSCLACYLYICKRSQRNESLEFLKKLLERIQAT